MRRIEKSAYELGAQGRRGFRLPALDVPERELCSIVGNNLRENAPELPECSEIEAVRHFTALSTLNFGVDSGFYPLGSCTMKYNPKICDKISSCFNSAHPFSPEEDIQGCLELAYRLERSLSAICGMDSFSLSPSAGAHGELTGLMIIAARHENEKHRRIMLIPDSAHGTNPASAAQAGFTVRTVPSGKDGLVDLAALRAELLSLGDTVAGLMLTNPNTLGLFERDIMEISEAVHKAGGLLYYDGANLNAIMGRTSPGAMGFDVVHVNLHKTFAAPHGGGGPGAGPVGVVKSLTPYLPAPRVEKRGDGYTVTENGEKSIGRVSSYFGNFSVLVRAFAYIRLLGADGLKEASETAVMNANYLRVKLGKEFEVPRGDICMHEFVLSAGKLRDETGVSALDLAKGLIDMGYHPPTIYFPLIVREAMMIEPTETEAVETLDEFAGAMLTLKAKAETDPDALHSAPVTTVIGRPDEASAARKPKVKF